MLQHPYGPQDPRNAFGNLAAGAADGAIKMFSREQLPVKAAVSDHFAVFNKVSSLSVSVSVSVCLCLCVSVSLCLLRTCGSGTRASTCISSLTVREPFQPCLCVSVSLCLCVCLSVSLSLSLSL